MNWRCGPVESFVILPGFFVFQEMNNGRDLYERVQNRKAMQFPAGRHDGSAIDCFGSGCSGNRRKIELCRCWLYGICGAYGVFHDTGAWLFLWRNGQAQKCIEYNHDVPGRNRHCGAAMDFIRLFLIVWLRCRRCNRRAAMAGIFRCRACSECGPLCCDTTY